MKRLASARKHIGTVLSDTYYFVRCSMEIIGFFLLWVWLFFVAHQKGVYGDLVFGIVSIISIFILMEISLHSSHSIGELQKRRTPFFLSDTAGSGVIYASLAGMAWALYQTATLTSSWLFPTGGNWMLSAGCVVFALLSWIAGRDAVDKIIYHRDLIKTKK